MPLNANAHAPNSILSGLLLTNDAPSRNPRGAVTMMDLRNAALKDAAITGVFRDPVTGVVTNSNYYSNLLAQGKTHDPATGLAINAAQALGPQGVKRLALEGFEQGIKDRQAQQSARRDVKALYDLTQGATPQIDMQTAMKARASLERKYGANTLVHLPEYRALVGKNEAFEAQKQAAVEAKTKATGRDIWKFDDEAGEVVMDREKLVLHNLDQEDAQIRQKPLIEKYKFDKEMASKRLNQQLDLVEKAYEQNKKLIPKQAYEEYKTTHKQAWDRFYEEIGETRSQTVSPTQPAASAPKLSHPKLPAGMNIRAEYPSFADAGAGLKSDQYGIIKGRLVRKTLDGRLEEVK